ncbi:MAG: DUF4163 domain-containing protein [Bacteroidaceae bacterium]|nr:DUF4163 domain-containing protein [Bacteroidaceae bacterium]
MKYISIKLALLTVFATLYSCQGSTDNSSDSDSTKTEVVEDDDASHFTLEHYTYTDTCEYASVSFNIELPTNRTDEAKKMRDVIYKALTETCSEYIETKIAPYKEGNLVDIAQYVGVATFDKLSEASQTQYLVSTAELRENGEDYSEVPLMVYDTDNTVQKIYENKNIVVFNYNTYIYLGGAHGSTNNTTYTFNIKTGELITGILNREKLNDMQPLLWAGVREYFKEFDPDMSDSEIRDQLFIDGSTIPLPSIEPAPMEKGLCLSYPRYEIASYAAGSVSFIIPYDKVMPFITDKAKKAMGLK